jgi:hypothetical protein
LGLTETFEGAMTMDELTIHLFIDSEGNYQYRIYDCAPEDVPENRSIDGGVCSMTMANAVGIAIEQTRTLLRRFRL